MKVMCKKDLTIPCYHLMGNYIFNPENMPDRIGKGFTVISICTRKRRFGKGLIRVSTHNLSNLLKHFLAESQKLLNSIYKGCFLRQQFLYFFIVF